MFGEMVAQEGGRRVVKWIPRFPGMVGVGGQKRWVTSE